MGTIAVDHDIVVVFDLDDTLFSELDYVRSGRLSVIRIVEELYGINVDGALVDTKADDFLGLICEEAGLPVESKPSLLWHYRLHLPVISPRAGVREAFLYLRSVSIPICILTDGRSVSQRRKIQALDLNPDGIYISEETGAEKPATEGYRQIVANWSAKTFLYVGDNPSKDFVAANELGWRTIGMRPDFQSVHEHNLDQIPASHHPHAWIDNFEKLLIYIKKLRQEILA